MNFTTQVLSCFTSEILRIPVSNETGSSRLHQIAIIGIIIALKHEDPNCLVTATELGRALNIDSSVISKNADLLIERGFITKTSVTRPRIKGHVKTYAINMDTAMRLFQESHNKDV